MVYRGLSNGSWNSSNWHIKKDPESVEFKQNSSTSNPNISKTLSHGIINNTLFWKCVTRPFRCININCFNRLRFLARSAQICKNCIFLDNSNTITQKENMETREMTPYFSNTFTALIVCNIHFWTWKYLKSIFMWSLIWSIRVCKTPQFLTKS